MVLEIQRPHGGIGRHGIDPLLPPGPEQMQRGRTIELRVVERRHGGRRHQVPLPHHDRIVVAGGDMAVAGDVFVQLHVHQPVFRQPVHAPRFRPAGLQLRQRLWQRHLIHHDLTRPQRLLRYAMPGLDDGRVRRVGRGGDASGAGKKAADADCVGGVVCALVDHFQHVRGAQDAGRHLNATRAPAIRQRHLPAAERDLIPGDRHRLQDRTADHALGLFVEVGEVIGHRASGVPRIRRTVSSSA